jgi:hypothetical protein
MLLGYQDHRQLRPNAQHCRARPERGPAGLTGEVVGQRQPFVGHDVVARTFGEVVLQLVDGNR